MRNKLYKYSTSHRQTVLKVTHDIYIPDSHQVNYNRALVVYCHMPEVFSCICQRSLSHNKPSSVLVALCTELHTQCIVFLENLETQRFIND